MVEVDRATKCRRILFVVTCLNVGGAEKMLCSILRVLHGKTINAAVISLRGRGALSTELEAMGVRVLYIESDNLFRGARSVWECLYFVRDFSPKAIQGWMYHGNLAAFFLRLFGAPKGRLIWSIHNWLGDINDEKLLTRLVIKLGARISRWVDAVIYVSEKTKRQHEVIGYDSARSRIIENGIDTRVFSPDQNAYGAVRDELGVFEGAPLIGMMARFAPIKGHDVFLSAARKIVALRPDVYFVLAGNGVTPENPFFQLWLEDDALAGRVHLLGEREDVPRLTAALDVATSTSRGEAFGLVIAEAMSCGVPCVVSDLEVLKTIVGDTGLVVPIGDASAFATAWQKLLAKEPTERATLGNEARKRVITLFSLENKAMEYSSLYEDFSNASCVG